MMDGTGSLRLINSTFIWDISDFPDKCKTVGKYIESPYFAAGNVPLEKIKWYLRLYPYGDEAENESFLSLFLYCKFCSDINEVEVSYKFYLWNDNEINTEDFDLQKFTDDESGWGTSEFFNRNKDEFKSHLSLSTNSTLSIACCITSSCYSDGLNLYKEIITDFKAFFLSDNLSDVTIEVDDKKLKAHKIILSARSEVFSAMFNHNMIENNENIVKITDSSHDVMKEILRFIYCGDVENLDLLSKELLAAADKYNIPSLKRVCEEALMKNLNVNNACEILSIVHLHQCPKLKQKVIDFIIKHIKKVVDTEGFNEMKDHNLLAEILRETALKVTV